MIELPSQTMPIETHRSARRWVRRNVRSAWLATSA